MNGHHPAPLCIALLTFLLGACGKSSRFEPPIAKTNPNPTQRYEITVELFDPPPDIKSITGKAYFSIPDVICMPTPDRIAGYTPGSSYSKEFSLVRIDGNTYQGHVFLDWPVDEDYYGLGVCKWEIAKVKAILTRSNDLIQAPNMNQNEVISESGNISYCREVMRDKYDFTCFTPIDQEIIRDLDPVSYKVRMSSIKD